MVQQSFGKGIFFAVSAYFMWGLLPIYWRLLAAIPPAHILSFRIILSLVFVAGILFFMKNTSWLKFYKDRHKLILLTLAGLTVTFNWGLFIWAVNNGRTIETSLGYYINPLVSVILGLCFFKEKLKPLQIIAFSLAAIGVTTLTVFTGRLPWVSLGLAISFGFYGMIKKTVKLSSLESLGVETLVAAPIGLLLLFASFDLSSGIDFPNFQNLVYLLELPFLTIFILLFCGAVSSIPLYLFSQGAKILPLSALGFCQFLAPTMSFFTGFFIFGEFFPTRNFIAFGFIWAAVVVYIISLNYPRKKC
jgi:chloramphenicol-sensitive protein RarD